MEPGERPFVGTASARGSRVAEVWAIGVDAVLLAAAWWLSMWLRFNFDIPTDMHEVAWMGALCAGVFGVVSLLTLGAYRHIWRYVSVWELRELLAGVVAAGVLTAGALLMLRLPALPRSVLVLWPMVAMLLLAGARISWRLWSERSTRLVSLVEAPNREGLLVCGALSDVEPRLRALRGSERWQVRGIVTPNANERGLVVQGVPVLGVITDLAEIATHHGAKALLLASAPGAAERRDAAMLASDARLKVLTLPHADDVLSAVAPRLKQASLDDLLGRPSVILDAAALSHWIAGRSVVVTGAGGSIGSEMCRQVARLGAARIVCLDTSEYALYAIERELRAAHPQLRLSFVLANVRDMARVQAIFSDAKPTVVIHAAAYKHVPLVEEANEIEGLRNNVLGSTIVARAAGAAGAKRFVMVSTDKAVNPTNVMGASKRLAEMMIQAVSREFAETEFVSVRFGNVLGSSGSVVPLFEEQIAKGGPVTVTHPEIVRYFMTIPEAAQLVLQAGFMGKSGQIFVLDMGDPVRIVDLARIMISLSGKTEEEVPITFSGLRPGEKLYEELLADDETTEPTPHPKLRVAKRAARDEAKIDEVLAWIEQAGSSPDPAALRHWLKAQVGEYQPQFA
jgi:FlaA1/EpsC-like NDP-sugar epimerase